MKRSLFVIFAVLLLSVSVAAQGNNQSLYTDLRSNKCKTIEVSKETGGSVQSCRGLGGYKLLVLDDDARQSITVIDPGGKKHPLDFWQVVTFGFSSIGEKAEWRVARTRGKLAPMALIVRVNASEDAENPSHTTSYLVVTKITPDKICVTHKIPAGARANVDARRAADSAASAPCLKEVSPSARAGVTMARTFRACVKKPESHPRQRLGKKPKLAAD